MFKKVELWLAKNDLSMAWLAKELGEHSATVSNWKTRNSIPKAKLASVASLLGCTTEQLLSDEPLPDMADCPPETAALLIEAFGGVTICDRIHWADINPWLEGENVGYAKFFIPFESSKRSFVTILPASIGLSINEISKPGETIAVDAGLTVDDIGNNDFVLAKFGKDKHITAWQFQRIGSKEFLLNQDPRAALPPIEVESTDWTLIGKILYSMNITA